MADERVAPRRAGGRAAGRTVRNCPRAWPAGPRARTDRSGVAQPRRARSRQPPSRSPRAGRSRRAPRCPAPARAQVRRRDELARAWDDLRRPRCERVDRRKELVEPAPGLLCARDDRAQGRRGVVRRRLDARRERARQGPTPLGVATAAAAAAMCSTRSTTTGCTLVARLSTIDRKRHPSITAQRRPRSALCRRHSRLPASSLDRRRRATFPVDRYETDH